jgi:hypothetical protein
MAHFAKLDENNIVTQVLVVNNEVLIKTDGTESEHKGKVFLNGLFGNGTWVQTSYNNNFRKQFASIGGTYDKQNDVFINEKLFTSWILDENFDWQPPTPYPNDNKTYFWNQETQAWQLIEQPFNSWTWNETDFTWQPPIPYPTDGQHYEWNEDTLSWELITNNT